MLSRAYSVFTVKSVDTERRVIEGIASTPATDRDGDVLEPRGAQFKLPMPLLWQHNAELPIWQVISAKVTDAGIWIKAQIAKDVLPEIDRAWALIKSGLVRGFSVGFQSVGSPERTPGGYRFVKWAWHETSAVTIPANQHASISLIKSLDCASPAATGTRERSVHPGVTGSPKAQLPMNVSTQISEVESDLRTKSARLEELLNQSGEEGGLNEAEETELTSTTEAVTGLNKKMVSLRALEGAQSAQAKAVAPSAGRPQQERPRAQDVQVKNYEKGTLFTRYAMAVAAGKGSYSDSYAYAKRFTNTPEIAMYVKHFMGEKALEGTSVVQSPGWGGELVNPDTAMTEFVELLNPMTIIGKVPGFRRVPFNIPIITQTGGSTFEWVGEGAVKPVGELAFDRTTMGYTKCAGIIVMTEELVRLSTPAAEATARRDMLEQAAKFLDEQFIRVGVTAGANNPASITNSVAAGTASGADADALKADLNTAIATLLAAEVTPDGLVIVTTPTLALGISLLTNALGQTPNGFNVTPSGGSLLGYPVIVSSSVDAGHVVVFKPSEIFLADDGQVRLDASNQATLDMNGGNTPVFSLWQRNCVGLRAERWINWQKRRPTVVAVIDTAAYAPTTSE
jgi:HK97 family phage major capsid protein/HK97 family phage prohead protease